MSDAPNKTRIGFAKTIPTIVKTTAPAQTIEKEVFIIRLAFLESPIPRLMEKRGAPPLPNKLLQAVTIVIMGKQSPTAPRAAVLTSGIRAI